MRNNLKTGFNKLIYRFGSVAAVSAIVLVVFTLNDSHPAKAESNYLAASASIWSSKSSVVETSPGVWQVTSTGTNISGKINYNSTVTLTANGNITPTDQYNLGDVAAGEVITKVWGVTMPKGQDFKGEVVWHGCQTNYPC